MKSHKVSIVIPAYNEEADLPGCLASIQALQFPEEAFEVLLIDNGSTDRTREIAQNYGAKVFRNAEMNVSGLRNLGVEKSTGDIVAFVDADCLVSKKWLKHASLYFNDKRVVAWGSPPTLPEKSTWVQKTWYIVRKKSLEVQEVDWLESMNLFVRKHEFQAVGGFNAALVTCEDVDFSYSIAQAGRIVSDARIEVVHLGEAATLREFMRKEIWRGRSNLHGIMSHGFEWKEVPSLAVPLYFGILVPLSSLAVLIPPHFKWLAVPLIVSLLPSLAVFYKVKAKITRIGEVFRLLLLIQVYFFSRTVAVVKRG